jgi:tetratricopeptide (TPR) repeat protein
MPAAKQNRRPFTRPTVEFMPGAFAYHLYSFSALTLRTPDQYWVGPLLQKGATATMGFVEEPYLVYTPDISVFFPRLVFLGFTFGEAAYAAQNSLSWQTIVVGDPLYRPGGKAPDLLHREMEQRKDPLVDWSYIRVVNQAVASGASVDEAINFIEQLPLARKSAVLKEKLGDLYLVKKQISDALDTYETVLKLNPTPQQRIRVMLNLAQRRTYFGPERAAFDLYEKFLKEFPDYPDLLAIYQKLLPLAKKMDQKEEVERCEREIKRLAPPPAAPAAPKS